MKVGPIGGAGGALAIVMLRKLVEKGVLTKEEAQAIAGEAHLTFGAPLPGSDEIEAAQVASSWWQEFS